MKRLISAMAVATVLTATSAPVWADLVKIYEVQPDGGVIERPGAISVKAAELLIGDAPEGTTGVVMERGKEPLWTRLSPLDVNERFGGKGDPVVELFPKTIDPTEPPEVFPQDDPDTIPIELFPQEDTNGKITPLAGVWIGNVIGSSSTGCPPGVAEGVAAQLAALDGTPIEGTIDASFTASVAYPDLDWAQRGPNSWYATVGSPPESPIIARTQFALRVMSPDLISLRQQINFGGAMMGNCETKTNADYVRQ